MAKQINIVVQWGDQDPNNQGWEYYTSEIDQCDSTDSEGKLIGSGAIDGRQSRKVRPSRRRVLQSAGLPGGRNTHIAYR